MANNAAYAVPVSGKAKRCITLLPVLVALAGCGPLSAVSFVGSNVIRTVQNYQQREAEEAPRRHAAAKANLDLGIEYMRRGEYSAALARLEHARETEPGYAATYSVLGLLYQLLREYDQAEANFKKAIKLDQDNSDYQNNYGQFLCKRERVAEAEELFVRAADNPLYMTPAVPYNNAGSCAFLHDDIATATGHFRKALALDPQLPSALYYMTEIEYRAGSIESANGYLERYLAVAGHNPKTLWLGIRIKNELGDKDATASYSLLLRNQFPDSEETGYLKQPLPPRQLLAAYTPSQPGPAQLLQIPALPAQPELLSPNEILAVTAGMSGGAP